MGWAKYYEDDVEITMERQYLMHSFTWETETKSVYTTIIPKTAIPEDEMTKTGITEKQNHGQKASMKYQDIYITCRECGKSFLFSAESQKIYDTKGWKMPKRCKNCRTSKRVSPRMISSVNVHGDQA